jgi:hypothetical protein
VIFPSFLGEREKRFATSGAICRSILQRQQKNHRRRTDSLLHLPSKKSQQLEKYKPVFPELSVLRRKSEPEWASKGTTMEAEENKNSEMSNGQRCESKGKNSKTCPRLHRARSSTFLPLPSFISQHASDQKLPLNGKTAC